jgi:alpha-1,2-mannosyltransferase
MESLAKSHSSTASRWFLAALVLLFVALAVRYSFKVLDDRSAFNRWRPQIQQLDTADISARFNYPNPPIMAVLLEPLALLPPVAGALVWFTLKSAMALVSLYWVFRLVESAEVPFPAWAKALTVVLSLKPIVDDLNHGNVNLFILFLVMASLTAFRSRRDVLAGVLLGLAIACKVTPALFLPYFLWKRQWRVLAGCALGLVLFLYPGLVPALRLGWDDNQQQLFSWYEGMVRPFVSEGKVTSEHINQSLPGVVFRLLTDNPSFVVWINDIETPARYHNFLSLTTDQAKWLVKGCMGLFALLFVFYARTPATPRQGWRLSAELGLVMLGMLLFSERTWKHHCVTLMLPFGVICYHLAACRPGAWVRRGLIASLVVAGMLMFVTGLGGGKDRAESAVSPGVAKLALVYGAYTWAWIVLLLALVGLLRSGRASSSAPDISSSESAREAA